MFGVGIDRSDAVLKTSVAKVTFTGGSKPRPVGFLITVPGKKEFVNNLESV